MTSSHDVDAPIEAAASKAGSDQPKTQTPAQWAAYWSEQLVLAEREHHDYWKDCDDVIQLYRTAKSNKRNQGRRRMNVLYSNVETLKGAVYARTGKPDIRQRFGSQDQVAKQAAELIERCMTVSLDNRRHEDAIKHAVVNAILTNRAVVRYDYEATTEQYEAPPPLQPVVGMAGDLMEQMEGEPPSMPEMLERITSQKVVKKFFGHRDFLHSPATQWRDVWWVAFRERMTREDLLENKFNRAKEVPLNWAPMKDGKVDTNASDNVRRAEVWVIWSSVHRQRFFVVKGFDTVLRVDEDPYNLEGFFPMPQPLYMSDMAGAVIPDLEYHQYSELAEDLEEVTTRISRLTKAVKRRGVRDSTIKALERVATAGDNEFVPVENYAQFVAKGGLNAAYQVEDIKPLVDALVQLFQSKAEIEATIDKMSGIADIMRGNVDPDEKLGQTEIKAQFGGIRIKDRQKAVQQFIRDGMRIEAELMAEHYEPETLQQMAGMEVSPEVMAVLRDDRLRGIRIDIETDSTVYEDSEAQKAAINEAISAAVELIDRGVMTMQAAPEMGEVIFEMLAMLLRNMKGGRAIEDVIDRARMAMQQRMSQPQQPEQDPRAETEQIKAEAARAKSESDMRMLGMKEEAANAKHQRDMERMQTDALLRPQPAPSTNGDGGGWMQ